MISSDLHRLMLKTTGGFQGIVPVVPAMPWARSLLAKAIHRIGFSHGIMPSISRDTFRKPKGKEAVGPSQTAEAEKGMEQGLAQVESLIRAMIIICSGSSLLSVLLL